MKHFLSYCRFLALGFSGAAAASAQSIDPGSWWLHSHGLDAWEWSIDHDGDAFTTAEEYAAGTDPFDADSKLRLDLEVADDAALLSWLTKPGAVYRPEWSTDLLGPLPLDEPITGDGLTAELSVSPLLERAFFQLRALAPEDTDGDGLTGVEEGALGTRPDLADTDGDGVNDGDEVCIYFTDPLVPDAGMGTIRGTVFRDPDKDGTLTDGVALANTTVYLDANYNGIFDYGERSVVTGSSGAYEFRHVPAGLHHVRQVLPVPEIQTFPPRGERAASDGWPDELVEYVHDDPDIPGFEGNLPVPYGVAASDWPGNWSDLRGGGGPFPVSPDLVLKPLGIRDKADALGRHYYGTEVLTIPKDGWITVRFDEPIIDGPGPDLRLHTYVPAHDERAILSLGATAETLHEAGEVDEGDGILLIDLADYGEPGPVHYVRLKALDASGAWFGYEIVAMEALNVAPPDTTAHSVVITGNETVEGRDFGRYYDDLPPTLVLGPEDGNPETPGYRAGETVTLRVFAHDDLGIATLSVLANGSPVTLGADSTASVPLTNPGTLTIEAVATDTANQTTTAEVILTIPNADGTPLAPPGQAGLTATSSPAAPAVRILSPGPGTLVDADTPVIASITGQPAATEWTLEYAPVDLVDPWQLSAADPDYILLATGTGNVFSAPVGTLPASTLPDGVYFLRLCARNSPTQVACFGQVVAKNVAVEELRPLVTITSPAVGSEVFLTADIMGTITSARPVREWFVDMARQGTVDPGNPGAPDPDWKRIASGTGTVDTPSVLATFDATLVTNDSWLFRVIARNDIGLGWVEPLQLTAAGEAKFGRNRLEFPDISISLAGFPVSFVRVYDSLQSGKTGDLGYGWSLGMRDTDIRETVPDTGTGTLFGTTPFRDGARVYITAPEGPRLGFTFRPEVAVGSLAGVVYRAVFEPDAGNYYQLEVPEGRRGFLSLKPDGTVNLFFAGLPWNPDRYILTAPGGNRYTCHEDHGLLKAGDPDGNFLTFDRNGVTHSSGAALRFLRDAQGRITSVRDDAGGVWSYTYNGNGDLVTSTDPENHTTTYQYLTAPAHYLSSIQDPLGRTPVRYEYEEGTGRLIAAIDAAGNRKEVTWDPGTFTGNVTSARGFTSVVRYNGRGNVIEETDAGGNKRTYAYTDPLNPDKQTAVTDELGNTWTLVYDAMGRATRLDGPVVTGRPRLTRAYDAFGNVTEAKELDGAESVFTYDEHGNLTRQEPGQGKTLDIVRTPSGLPLRVSYGPAYSKELQYTAQGKLAGITDTLGNSSGIVMGTHGNIRSITNRNGQTSTFAFSFRGVPVSQTDFAGNTITTEETAYGHFTTMDELGTCSEMSLDANNRPVTATVHGGGVMTPEFDPSGNLEKLTDALGNETKYTYDFAERLTSATDAAGCVLSRTWDAAGRLLTETRASGKKRSFVYDKAGRIFTESWHAADDSVFRTLDFSYGAGGALSAVNDTAGGNTNRYAFSGILPQVSRETVTYAGQVAAAVVYDWSAGNYRQESPVSVELLLANVRQNRIRTAYMGEKPLELLWDGHGGGPARAVEFHYNPDGSLDRLERKTDGVDGTDLLTRFLYAANGAVASLRHEDGAGNLVDPRAAISYTYDAANRVATVSDASNTMTVSYDGGARLSGVDNSDPARPDEAYTFDIMGNRLTSHTAPSAAMVAPGNRIFSDGKYNYTYDADGNVASRRELTSGVICEFAYDHRNRLIEALVRPSAGAEPTTTVRYDYDFRDVLISREINGAKTWIVNDRGMPVGEFADGTATASAAFLYTPDRLDDFHAVSRTGTGERWFLKDSKGSVRGITDPDGVVLTWQDYDAFGNLTAPATTGETIQWVGRFSVPELNLYENRRRFYDPFQGRFLSPDPMGYSGGDLNLYAYASSLPLNFTDPTGLAVVEYSQLADLALTYIDGLCNYASCLGGLYGSTVKGVVGLNPSVGNPVLNCALNFLPFDPCFKFTSKNGGLAAGLGGMAADLARNKDLARVALGFEVMFTVQECGEISFDVKPAACGQ